MTETELREKLVHIDQALIDHDRKRQEIALAPWQVFGTLVVGAAGFFVAGAAFVKVMM